MVQLSRIWENILPLNFFTPVNVPLPVPYLSVWPQSPSDSSNLGILIIKEVATFKDFYAKFDSKMAPKWRELAPFFFSHCHRAIIF